MRGGCFSSITKTHSLNFLDNGLLFLETTARYSVQLLARIARLRNARALGDIVSVFECGKARSKESQIGDDYKLLGIPNNDQDHLRTHRHNPQSWLVNWMVYGYQ